MHKTRETVDRLLELQKLDAQITELERQRDRIPEERAELEKEKSRLESRLSALQEERARREGEIRRLEGEIASLRSQMEEETKKARRARTPRELEAIQKEIAYLSRLIREKENQILEHMEALEGKTRKTPTGQEEHVPGLLEQIRQMEEEANARIPEINSRLTVLDRDLKTLEERLLDFAEERERQIHFIDVEWLELYERIRRRQGLPVLVELFEGACGGCGNVLSEDRLMALEDEGIIQCEMCGRLIYAPEWL